MHVLGNVVVFSFEAQLTWTRDCESTELNVEETAEARVMGHGTDHVQLK
jgi:hypothetical protein